MGWGERLETPEERARGVRGEAGGAALQPWGGRVAGGTYQELLGAPAVEAYLETEPEPTTEGLGEGDDSGNADE